MTISTLAYARDKDGALAVFKIEKTDKLRSYKAVIEEMKAETGAPRTSRFVPRHFFAGRRIPTH